MSDEHPHDPEPQVTGASLSRPARWRIASLIVVHLLIAIHIIHWRLAGTTLSSIQLSDAGRFAAEGVATASLYFFAFLLLGTAVFGRFFCSWGCHMLALQELCRFLLGRVGIRPKLVMSRLLWIIPFCLAFYIFFEPALERAWHGVAFPPPTTELTTSKLWANLPIMGVAIVIVLGGGLMVYLLGALSFCKYVCPYGALFAAADAVALGRIRLTGECDGCAHCTAACTTGVRVHEEVQRLGMVANSGCMRCLECVSSCPQGVLAYRFGRPALSVWRRAGLTRYGLSLAEECLILVLFGASFVAINGLYEVVPLMLAVALAVLVAYLGVMSARLLRQPLVALRGLILKQPGRLSGAGKVFATCALIVFVGVGHSALIQYHRHRATAALDQLGFPQLHGPYAQAQQRLAREAAAQLEFCSRYGLLDSVTWNMQQAWAGRVLAEPDRVERSLRRAIALDPTLPEAHFNLGKELARQGRRGEATQAFNEAVRLSPLLAEFIPSAYQIPAMN